MSERLSRSPELKQEKIDSAHEEKLARHHEKAAEKARHAPQENLERIIEKIEKEAVSSKDALEKDRSNLQDKGVPSYINSDMSAQALGQNLKKIQHNLSTTERQFSKVIHNPVVDKVSETAGQTIARPSGLLFGGIFALITSLLIIYICNRYGYEYNYLLSIFGFVGGFFLGLVVEMILKLVRR